MDITAAFSALLQTKSVIDAAIDVRDNLKLMELKSLFANQLLELQDALIAHYARHIEIQQELAISKTELLKLQSRFEDRANYELVKLGVGFFVYAFKPSTESGKDAAHYLCQPCLDSGTKSVLQPSTGGIGSPNTDSFTCPTCKLWIPLWG